MTNESKKRIGRYELERELGRGGMAIVYLARDPELNRVVALKLIRKGAFPDEQMDPMIERFRREARALAKLDHPNIVKVLDYGDYEGSPYLVMDYLEGATLKEVKKPLKLSTAVRLIRPVAEALDYVHRKGLLHRDVKPSNIMLTRDERVILTDFGIAKWIGDDGNQATLTGTGVGIGTPEYMAPEQGRGKGVDARSDLYSLSIVFYELITGVKPFQGETPVDVLIKQATEPVPDPREFVPDLSDSTVRFFDIALAKRPDNRYPTTADFLRDLDGLRLTSSGGKNGGSSGRTLIQTVPAPGNPTGSSVRFGGTDLRKVREATIFDPSLKRIPSQSSSDSDPACDPEQRKTFSSRTLLALGLGLLAVFLCVFALINRGEPKVEDIMPFASETPQLLARATVPHGETPVMKPTNDDLALTQWEVEAIEATDDAALRLELERNQKETEAKASSETETAVGAQIGTIAALERTKEALNRSATEAAVERTAAESELHSATENAAVQETAAAATEAARNPYAHLRIGSHVRIGRYEQDNDRSNGAEDIEWRVIDVSGGTALLISRYGLDQRVYHERYVETNWDQCSLRAWLNGTFYDEVFSAEEKKYILETEVVNEDNRSTGALGGPYTRDKIFLLSMDEAGRYFSGSSDRIARPTHYALANGAWVSKESGYEGNAWWWLRSPGQDSKQAARVFHGGAIDTIGPVVNDPRGTIRPVFRLKIDR